VAGLEQIEGHGCAHVTQADECDSHSVCLTRAYLKEMVVFTLPAVVASSNQRSVTVLVCV
jgi:hypothetical protein